MKIDTGHVRSAARGHWHSILPSLTGIDSQLLDERNHPCPCCGGTDRFRCLDIEAGACFCNQCFREKNGDGFAAVMWLRGIAFGEALREVAEYLNIVEMAGPRREYVLPFNPIASPAKAMKKPATAYPTMYKAIETLKCVMQRESSTCGGEWLYCDAAGRPTASVLRFNRPDGTKEFRPVSKWPEGWFIKGPPEPRPLYRLPQLLLAETCWVTEGEKAADAATHKFGLTATTSMNGSKSPGKTDWTPLRGKRVVILPDNDEPGRKYAMAVATILSGLNCDVRILELPRLPIGGDIADWDGTRNEVIGLC